MATLTINIPAGQANRVIDAVAAQHGYKSTLDDGTANPQTKQDFLKAVVVRFLKDNVAAQEANAAAENARTAAIAAVDSGIALT